MTTLLNADWLSSREIKIHFNSSEFVAPQILVNALACARRKCGATNQNLLPVFSREEFARYTSSFTLYGILSPRRVWCERTMSMPAAAKRNIACQFIFDVRDRGILYIPWRTSRDTSHIFDISPSPRTNHLKKNCNMVLTLTPYPEEGVTQ